jgi:predicted amidohydrolase
VIDPCGKVLLDMGAAAGVGLVDLDLAQVDAVRQRIPALDHRRPNPDVTKL